MQPRFLWLHKKSNLTPQHLHQSCCDCSNLTTDTPWGDGLTQAASRSHQLVSCETHQDTLFSALPSIWATGCATETVKLLSALGEEKKKGAPNSFLWTWHHHRPAAENNGCTTSQVTETRVRNMGKILRAGSVPRGRYSPTAPRIQLSDKRSRTFT